MHAPPPFLHHRPPPPLTPSLLHHLHYRPHFFTKTSTISHFLYQPPSPSSSPSFSNNTSYNTTSYFSLSSTIPIAMFHPSHSFCTSTLPSSFVMTLVSFLSSFYNILRYSTLVLRPSSFILGLFLIWSLSFPSSH